MKLKDLAKFIDPRCAYAITQEPMAQVCHHLLREAWHAADGIPSRFYAPLVYVSRSRPHDAIILNVVGGAVLLAVEGDKDDYQAVWIRGEDITEIRMMGSISLTEQAS